MHEVLRAIGKNFQGDIIHARGKGAHALPTIAALAWRDHLSRSVDNRVRGGEGMLISRLQAVLAAVILIVVTAAVSTIVVSKWNPFPPKDYEDCAARAAKDVKSKDALSVLLSICASDFTGRRKGGGGYTYYDSCRDISVDIGGSNPTATELQQLDLQCRAYLGAQEQREAEVADQRRKTQQAAKAAQAAAAAELADQKRRAQEARAAAEAQQRLRKARTMAEIRVNASGFTPSFPDAPWVVMKIEVTNGSKEAQIGRAHV